MSASNLGGTAAEMRTAAAETSHPHFTGSGVVQHLRDLLGLALLLRVERGAKRPLDMGWQRMDPAKMDDPRYLAHLGDGGNIGVLLGTRSGGLCSIDIDRTVDVEPFLALNPGLRSTLRTQRVRGCNLWVRVVGEYPKSSKLKTGSGEPWGEWRADGNQTIIYGEAIDRSKGEAEPTPYKFVVEAEPLRIEFASIQWLHGMRLPWVSTAAPSLLTETDMPDEEDRFIVVPGNEVSISESARKIFSRLATSGKFFTRGGAVVELAEDQHGEQRLELVRESAFRSRIEGFGRVCAWRAGNGRDRVLKPTLCSEDNAKALLNSREARTLLPCIETVVGCPVAVETETGDLKILVRGYYPWGGGLLVKRGEEPPRVGLNEATDALVGLLADFDFQTPGDRSRAIAAFISPALAFGGFLKNRVPADVAEADKSQSGKTFRQKMVAALYGEKPYVISQRERGVGSLEESFAQALIEGRTFIQFDNLRGSFNSPMIESFFTADNVGARVPHRNEITISSRGFFIFATSNGVDTTRDFANRSSIVRIRKREGCMYREYAEGDVLDHIQANQTYLLGCVFTVIGHWVADGKPRTRDTRHDFREWVQVLDWIVQHVFDAAPLMDGHQAAQERVSNPAMNFLRALCHAAADRRCLGDEFSASEFFNLAEECDVTVPGLKSTRPEDANKRVGVLLGGVFRQSDRVEVDGFVVTRSTEAEERKDGKGTFPMKTYRVERLLASAPAQ